MNDAHRFIVMRRDVDNRQPFQVGDDITTYELALPYPYVDLPRHSGHTAELLKYQEAVLQHANHDSDWRVVRDLRCDCSQRRSIAQLLAHGPSGRLWATMKPERVPVAFRAGRTNAVDGWALHGSAGEAPHPGGVATCKGCRTSWLVLSLVDDVVILRIVRAHHGGKVAPDAAI